MSLTPTLTDLAIAAAPNVDVLAQPTEVSTGGLRAWIQDNVILVILLAIACVVLVGGFRGNLSKVFTVGGLSLIGMAFLGIASSEDAASGIGSWILSLFGVYV